jgi:hypothetical protein
MCFATVRRDQGKVSRDGAASVPRSARQTALWSLRPVAKECLG